MTPDEQQAVASLSSRVDPHPRRAAFTYHWTGFPGSAKDTLVRYYDAMFYIANWGSTRLIFRFPKALVDIEQMGQYRVETLEYSSDAITLSIVGEYAILGIQSNEEEGYGWIDGEGSLDRLIGLREAVLQGDYRLLYLAWLMGVTLEYNVDENAFEPPVPPGLSRLTPALRNFVELFGVDEDLIQAAAKQSVEAQVVSESDLHQAISTLLAEEKNAFLLRLAQDEPHLSLALKQRLGILPGTSQHDTETRRTVQQLLTAAKALTEHNLQEQAARAKAQRIAELKALAQREDQVWCEIDKLIQKAQAKPYEKAVHLLQKLKELAEYQKQTVAFQSRLDEILVQYKRRTALMRRFRQAGLI